MKPHKPNRISKLDGLVESSKLDRRLSFVTQPNGQFIHPSNFLTLKTKCEVDIQHRSRQAWSFWIATKISSSLNG